MTRDQFIDGIKDLLDECFPGEQGGFQISEDDVSAVQNDLLEYCNNTNIDSGN